MLTDPAPRDSSWWGGALILIANFFLIWFMIIVAIFSVALIGAILVEAYTRGGLRGLALALVIMAALPAFCIALWLRASGEGQSESSREWWGRVAIGLVAGLFIAKGAWNMWHDPPGTFRSCLFCSPEVGYQPPKPLSPEPPR